VAEFAAEVLTFSPTFPLSPSCWLQLGSTASVLDLQEGDKALVFQVGAWV
jgi:hypothetical protein